MIRLFPILLSFIPIWLFFSLGRLSSTSYTSVEILSQQTFNDTATRPVSYIPIPENRQNFFNNDKFLAYFDKNNATTHQRFFSQEARAYLGECCYLMHNYTEKKHTYYNSIGQRLFDIELNGYPMISPDGSKIMFVSTDGSSLTLVDRTQKFYFENLYFDPRISTFQFSAHDNSFAIGSTSGKVSFFDFFGVEIFTTNLSDHAHPIIKSLAIATRQERMLAVLSGVGNEKLFFFQENPQFGNINMELKWEVETGEEARQPIALYLDVENGYVVKQSTAGFHRWQMSDAKQQDSFSLSDETLSTHFDINFDQPMVDSIFSSSPNYLLVTFVYDNKSQVWLFSSENLDVHWKLTLENQQVVFTQMLSLDLNSLYVQLHTKEQILSYRIKNPLR